MLLPGYCGGSRLGGSLCPVARLWLPGKRLDEALGDEVGEELVAAGVGVDAVVGEELAAEGEGAVRGGGGAAVRDAGASATYVPTQ